jgi:hypothetical protein
LNVECLFSDDLSTSAFSSRLPSHVNINCQLQFKQRNSLILSDIQTGHQERQHGHFLMLYFSSVQSRFFLGS